MTGALGCGVFFQLVFFPQQMALLLLTKVSCGFFLFCFFLEHYVFLGCRAENMQLFQKYFVNGSVTGVFCLPDFCFCSGSDFILVVNA